ncbi:flagellar basal body rod protein FlgB [Zhengella mangrovi]|uniref:Flagellar basal body rod protein FlgB n=1 Tax=Zhengella mangrovi TaxID=1982044 RepID=A0A2G1QKL1_9HYPH|nr:flagellar basal body protein [Zhengella mangrovi]PHP65738.1 flagellar basal body rod protein FlgB [Zhengella mangrovi]
MQILPLLNMAHQQATWLSARQSAVATNIANANTPDFKARTVTPFEVYLNGSGRDLAVTQPDHLLSSGEKASSARAGRGADYSIFKTAKPVVLETELLNQTELRNDYELNTAIVKSFHRMFMSVAKG